MCGQVVALLHFPLHFNRIECSGVTVEECLTDYQHWVSFLYGNYCKLCVVKFVFPPAVFISYIMCVNSLKDMFVYACVSVRFYCWCVLVVHVWMCT